MVGRRWIALATALLAIVVAGCAAFPDTGGRDWHEKVEGTGELGGPPRVPDPSPSAPPTSTQSGDSGDAPAQPSGCIDPDPQVVATCLEPVGAIAVLPDGESALVGERATGRVLRVRQGVAPVLVTTIPVDATGGGGLTGLVLSPAYREDQLVYAYITTPSDNRVVKIANGEPPKPVFTGIPRGATHNAGALGVDPDDLLLVATGDAGGGAPIGLAGMVLRIDTLGRPAPGNPDPASPVLSTGLTDPRGICVDAGQARAWVTDRAGTADVLHLVTPGQLPGASWRWPDRPGVAGCAADEGSVVVAETGGAALFVLRADQNGRFTGTPQTMLKDSYGRLAAASSSPDGLVWLGTVNKAGGKPVSSDDRVIRIQVNGGGGESRS